MRQHMYSISRQRACPIRACCDDTSKTGMIGVIACVYCRIANAVLEKRLEDE